ncbi:NtaA/DmoA family FMN-dependent monooxygenase [Gluconacetobacter tumulisoli]|uniref:NtaA/DmoA family FMN-dependent monooxygenase n=1 Tax=Gluconacetobacter tumulisoli TaxID=1286189 RepID=A0A7W4K4K3_9PROT|nr:NtaA/DmoA family FMN-dependent monooxygenase [Gluconacetobacter tumulisoli]MBB2200087.1 NtaA/DmoA family FMN-dependent monooxygenase [Gluconacetobacter tumulisoli]
MAADPFHLAWFLQGSSIQAWGEPWTGNISEDWMSAGMFLDLARSIERAGFDYILIEDSIYIGQNWENRRDLFLRNGMSVPRQEPSVVASLMLAATSRLGVVPTLSTFAYHPYLTARMVGTLDQISGGRAGWNMVTGSSDYAAQNFGMDHLPEHDHRYEMAAEYIDVVTRLWDSWEPGAIVADRKTGVLIDPEKVHTIDFKGEYYASRGPLNSGPCPQGRPVIAQAGGSAKGRAIAARHADTIVAHPKGIEAMKEYRNDVRAQMRAAGRNPDGCKILFMISPVLGGSEAEARERAARRVTEATQNVDKKLAQLGWITNIDFSGHDLDAPVGSLSTNGHQSSLAGFLRKAGKNTLREAIVAYSSSGASVDLVGTPDGVAAQMDEIMQEVGGDGFLITLPDVSRRSVAEITDGLIPALQQRGLTRRAYEHRQFRDNLLAF